MSEANFLKKYYNILFFKTNSNAPPVLPFYILFPYQAGMSFVLFSAPVCRCTCFSQTGTTFCSGHLFFVFNLCHAVLPLWTSTCGCFLSLFFLFISLSSTEMTRQRRVHTQNHQQSCSAAHDAFCPKKWRIGNAEKMASRRPCRNTMLASHLHSLKQHLRA